MDYGNIQQVPINEVYILPNRPECQIPPLGIECVLYGIQPSRKANPKGVWTEESNLYWKKQTCNVLLHGKVSIHIYLATSFLVTFAVFVIKYQLKSVHRLK